MSIIGKVHENNTVIRLRMSKVFTACDWIIWNHYIYSIC